mgnify:FL=1|jgi:hypothetical protein
MYIIVFRQQEKVIVRWLFLMCSGKRRMKERTGKI